MAQNLNFNLAVDTNSAVSSINQFFSAFDQGAAKAKGELNKAFGQTLQTTVEINLKNGELVAKKIQTVNQESKRLETAAKAINGQFAKTPNALKRQLAVLKQLQGDTAKYSNGSKKVSQDWKLVTQRIKEASDQLRTMTQGGAFQRMKSDLTGFIGKFATVQTIANVATGAIMGAARAAGDFANMAGRMETLSLQMEAFAGGAEEADAAFASFVDIAANSPFNLEQVAQAGKIMMAFGVETDVAVKSTEQLGIVAAATGGDINLLARNLGQIAAQGQAYTRDLTQFAIQGIPIWEEMSMVTGKSVAELKKMASEGQISFGIVQEALQNLTAEGSSFAEIAERMQETFQGRMARIEASINLLAKEFVATFNKMDKALGGIISGTMTAFADTLQVIAKNFDNIATFIGVATAATITYMTISNFGAIVGGIKMVALAIKSIVTFQNLANAAMIVFNALTGNWVAIAAAVAVGGVAYVGLSSAMEKAKQESEELEAAMEENVATTGKLTESQEKLAREAGVKDMIKDLERLNQVAEQRKSKLDGEIEVLEGMKGKVRERYEAEIEGIRLTMAQERAKQDELKLNHEQRLGEINERYDAELALIDLAIGKLRDKTESEQKLYDFEKKALQDKIKSGELDEEALLRAKARLERMNSQEKIAELLKAKAAKQAEKEAEITKEKEKQKTEMDALKARLEEQQKLLEELKQAREDELERINNAIESAKGMTEEVDATSGAVSNQIALVASLASEYNRAKSEVDKLSAALDNAIAKQRRLNAAKRMSGTEQFNARVNAARASGGPVSGGSTYQVNELGKEAFLSASGRLSMINAPAFGSWRAPSSGTVIPAHLTKQLDIPTGGVSLNSAASSNAARTGAGGTGAMLNAIKGAMNNGNTFNQNVTVQSNNPAQTANHMMVEMTRLRRRRLG